MVVVAANAVSLFLLGWMVRVGMCRSDEVGEKYH